MAALPLRRPPRARNYCAYTYAVCLYAHTRTQRSSFLVSSPPLPSRGAQKSFRRRRHRASKGTLKKNSCLFSLPSGAPPFRAHSKHITKLMTRTKRARQSKDGERGGLLWEKAYFFLVKKGFRPCVQERPRVCNFFLLFFLPSPPSFSSPNLLLNEGFC